MTLRVNLDVPAGASWTSPTWALLGEDGLGLPVDGWTVRAQVRPRVDDDTVLFTWATDPTAGTGTVRVEAVILDLDSGGTLETVGLTLALTKEQSAALAFSTGVFDCLAVRSALAYRVAEGAVRVSRGVTR